MVFNAGWDQEVISVNKLLTVILNWVGAIRTKKQNENSRQPVSARLGKDHCVLASHGVVVHHAYGTAFAERGREIPDRVAEVSVFEKFWDSSHTVKTQMV